MADLLAVERDGQVGVDGSAGHLARRRIDARREVDREHGRAEVVDLLDQPRRSRARLALEAGAEERVDEHVRVAELLLLVLRLRVDDEHVAARLLEHRAATRPSPPFEPPPQTTVNWRASPKSSSACCGDRPPRALHQLVDGSGYASSAVRISAAV